MKNQFLIAISIVILLLNACKSGNTQTVKTNLNATEFAEKMKALPDAPIIDVRTPEEFSKGHLINAKNVDWNGTSFDAQISKLDKTKPVLVYCLSGGRSGAAATKMREEGFTEVYEMEGGIMKWRGSNMPETTDMPKAATTGMTQADFTKLTNSNKIVLVDFYADWCGPCKKMKPYLEEISKDMADKVEVVRINSDDNQELCKLLNIDALPTLQVYKKNKMTWSNIGFIEKAEVVKQLK
jgi:thioredoxin